MTDSRGMALIGVIVLSTLLMALAVALTLAVRSDTQLRGSFASGITGFYAAEAGLDKGMGEYRNIFLNYNVPTGSDFNPRTLTLGSRTVNYQITQQLTAAPCDAGCSGGGGCVCKNVVLPQGQLFAGLNATQYLYTETSTGTNINYNVEAAVGANFLVGYVPLFQFVAFYANDLEIAPGPQMILQGRVHTNGNLYLDADAGPLNVAINPPAIPNIQVTAAKNIYRGRKRQDGECTGTVQVATQAGVLQTLACTGSNTRLVPSSELATWNGSMISNISSIAIPQPGLIQPPAGVTNNGAADCSQDNCNYWQKADLRIVMRIGQNDNLPRRCSTANIGCVQNADCPAGQTCNLIGKTVPYKIEVVDSAGVTDAARTTQLHYFMSDAVWNQTAGNSLYPGTMPIFVTDVPTACALTNPCTPANAQSASYNPQLPVAGSPNIRSVAASGVYGQLMGNGAPFQFDLDYRRGGFFNWRENKWMNLLNINVSDLIRWNANNGGALFTATDGTNDHGGIVIFATIDGPNSNTINNYGVRVFGSTDLPVPPLPGGIGVSADPTGVTIASDQAMYVLGSFNAGPPGPARQPASLIGDSVNVLSNNYWANQATCNNTFCRDGQSVKGLDDASRNGANTTINAAFLGGVDATPLNGGDAKYNGGLENYPRFQENWGGGPTLTYTGSFVSLGTPSHVNGAWCGTGGTLASGCNIYNPPTRVWNYDSAFNNVANLPPLTPRFVYVQQVLFTENFK